ncbi:condensation domain-containing protein [Amycolatopsis sp. EV170708-02-1]|uniref:condensation domain-containing protein n=1 Tax=Amycolatopsis sp. EV170708-02-1 TaxID=2919322 RepID=UPI001F0B840A|nr:condensation domain-containing protein [Amycolatopsis sp. EV170708-02-1]UMP06745.1 condensation domain-containing protein [Amycolatopsis sp. EV170708-02-1]
MTALSRSQEIVWLHEELFPESRAYNFTAILDLRGMLDEPALRESLATVLSRHEAFQLEVDTVHCPPKQRVNRACEMRYRAVEIPESSNQEADFEKLWREQHDEPFKIAEAPLVRWTLVRLSDRHHRLLHTEHHLVHDGWSFALVIRDLFISYRALTRRTAAELPKPRSYTEYVEHTGAADQQAGPRTESMAYWRRALDGATFDLPLPGLVPSTRVRSIPHGDQRRQLIAPELADRLRATARRDGHTVFSIFLTLFAELLRRDTGRTDLVIGSAVGNRPPGYEECIGMFVNTIPLRIQLQPGQSARHAADEVTEVLVRSLPHQGIPVQDLARELGVHSASGLDNPLFRVMFSAHDAPLPQIDGLSLDVSIQEALNTGTSRFDLDVVLIPDSQRTVNPRSTVGGMLLIWDFATDLYDTERISELQRQFAQLLESYVLDSGRSLTDLDRATGR